MIRALIGVAFLAASWLLGLGYYHQPDPLGWGICIAIGVLALGSQIPRIPTIEGWTALALLAPAMWIAPWPYKMSLLLMMLGMAALLAPHTPRWLRWTGSAMLSAGVVLLAQGLALLGYEIVTSWSHELSAPLTDWLAALARWVDIDAGASGSVLTIGSMRKTQPLGATWELLLDPISLNLIVGGAVMLWLKCRADGAMRWRDWLRTTGLLLLAVVLWLPLRIVLLLGLFLHRTLVTEYDETLIVNNQFWNTWLLLGLMCGALMLAWRFVRVPPPIATIARPAPAPRSRWQPVAVAALAGLGTALLAVALFWDPVGTRKPGRVLVDEAHSKWEPTTRSMDTNWYGQMSGYNYAGVYDYCSRFYDMGRITQPIDSLALSECDVLILKCTTGRFAPSEVDAIVKFVDRGGGLFLVGEHTDVFLTGSNINDIARRFGFSFRSDCLFGIDSVFDDHFDPPLVPHPVIQNMGPLEFAVSCSIEPRGEGRAIIRGVGLKNMPADYHASNFYPQVEDRSESRYGAFVQAWSTRYGQGRVAGFTDSTIWSNFCAFEPGKSELLLGFIEWLNHRNSIPDPRWWLTGAGVLCLLTAGVWKLNWRIGWLGPLAAAVFAWSLAAMSVRAAQQRAMPLPAAQRQMVMVAMDQGACSVPLPKDGFIGGKPGEFGIFERWIQRVGYFTCRREGLKAFDANMVVFAYPDKPVSPAYLEQLQGYVRRGGHILVIDSAKNTTSTANSLLYPFRLSVKHAGATPLEGQLISSDLPAVPVTDACEVTGGEMLSRLNQTPVAARAVLGKGSVTAIGYGERFTDLSMGVTGDVEPDAALRKVYDVEFQLLRNILEPSRR